MASSDVLIVRILGALVLLAAIPADGRSADVASITATSRHGRVELRFDRKGGPVSGSFVAENWTDLRELMPSGTGIWLSMLHLRTKGTFEGTFDAESRRLSGTAVAEKWQYDGINPTHAQLIRIAKEHMPLRDETIEPMDANTLRLVERVLKLKTLPTKGKLSGRIQVEDGHGQIGVWFCGDKSGSHRDPLYDSTFFGASWDFKLNAEKPPEAIPAAKPKGKPFVVPRLTADKETYFVGERVVLNLELEEWALIDVPGEAPRSEFREKIPEARFTLDIHVPSQKIRQASDIAVALSKCQPFVPFAPIVPGEYKVEATLKSPTKYLAMNEAVEGQATRVAASTTFKCVPPDQTVLGTTAARIDKLKALHKAHVPSHRDEVYEEHVRRNPPSVRHKLLEGIVTVKTPEIGDMEYGDYNNLYFGPRATWVCGSTQSMVLGFLDEMRFSHPDRGLMAGIHHAPLVRGFPLVPGRWFSGEHHGVVVYPAETTYDHEENRVFDPWPRQAPDDFSLKQFRGMYGNRSPVGAAVGVAPDYAVLRQGPYSGYPTHGSFVYWNRKWAVDLKGLEETPYPTEAPPAKLPIFQRAVCKCPVELEVADAEGRRLGMSGGKLVSEIPGSELSVRELAAGDYSWYIGLPRGEFRLTITGTGAGTYFLAVGNDKAAVSTYAAATDQGKTAELRLVTDRPGADLVLADGSRVPARVTTPADTPTEAVLTRFTAAKIKRLRQQAAEASQVPEDTPNGWSKSRVDPTKVLAQFAPLRLKKDYALRAYQYKTELGGNGFVWAMPDDSPWPEADRCPRLETHALNPPKPPAALDDAMDAIEGDGTPWSYLAASLLSRELGEFGAVWHGCQWTTHNVLDQDPLKAGAAEDDDPMIHPSGGPEQWKWLESQPEDWRPQVRVAKDSVTVTFFTFSGHQRQAIYRHSDVFPLGKYRPKSERKEVASGPPGFMF